MAFLKVDGLSSRYSSIKGPVYAVDDVDFELESGESMGIAGESACGKSTLGLSIIRMLSSEITTGKITFNDDSILDMDESVFDEKFRWKKISMIFQGAMNSVSLDENVLKKYPHELSGGMKQRVIIAMALLLKPKFVIADEPTTALDVLIQAQIINLLKSLKKEGMSFMLITHDLAVLSEIADKIGIMYGDKW